MSHDVIGKYSAFAYEFGCRFDYFFYVNADKTKIAYYGLSKYW